jgi:hypothetical protein
VSVSLLARWKNFDRSGNTAPLRSALLRLLLALSGLAEIARECLLL